MRAGLHLESVEDAEQQISLVCQMLKGLEVPATLSMMQVTPCFIAACCEQGLQKHKYVMNTACMPSHNCVQSFLYFAAKGHAMQQ